MKKRIIALCLVVIILCIGCFSSCKSGGKHGKFYPYNLSSYVNLGDYENVTYTKQQVSVTDEDVRQEIEKQLVKFGYASLAEKEGTVENKNKVNIDYTGYLNGKTFEGGSAKGASLDIGSGQFIEGFESGLVGATVGQTLSLNLKFPDAYHQKDYAGKDVVFEVTINKIYEYVYPELTDKIVSSISSQKTVSLYRESIYDLLLESETQQVKTNNRNAFINAVINCCKIKKMPKNEVEKYRSNLIKQYTNTASEENLSLEEFASYNGLTMEQFEEEMEKSAEMLVQKEMVFLMIADKEKISLTDEEYEKSLAEHMHNNGYTSRTSFLEAVGEDKFMGLLLVEKAIDTVEAKQNEK